MLKGREVRRILTLNNDLADYELKTRETRRRGEWEGVPEVNEGLIALSSGGGVCGFSSYRKGGGGSTWTVLRMNEILSE